MEGSHVNCAKCGRRLKKPSETGYGPVCARALFGMKQRKGRKVVRSATLVDPRQMDLLEVMA